MPSEIGFETTGLRLIIDVIPEGGGDQPTSYTSVVHLLELPAQDSRVEADHDGDNLVASTIAPEFAAAIATAGGAVASIACGTEPETDRGPQHGTPLRGL